jgi:hypothetical protein
MLTASVIKNKIASPATVIMRVTRQTLQFLVKSCNGQLTDSKHQLKSTMA